MKTNEWAPSKRGRYDKVWYFPTAYSTYARIPKAQFIIKDGLFVLDYWYFFPQRIDQARSLRNLKPLFRDLFSPEAYIFILNPRNKVRGEENYAFNIEYYANIDDIPSEEQMLQLAMIIENPENYEFIEEEEEENS